MPRLDGSDQPRTAPVGGVRASVATTVSGIYQGVIDRVLAQPHQISSWTEARSRLSREGDVEEVAGQIQRAAITLTPILRRLARTRKVPGLRRVPGVTTVITVAGVAGVLRTGVRDVQVVGSYLAARLTEAGGGPPDRELLRQLTVQLYVDPDKAPTVGVPTRPGRLLWRWLPRAVFGREVGQMGAEAVDAVARLDAARVLEDWAVLNRPVLGPPEGPWIPPM